MGNREQSPRPRPSLTLFHLGGLLPALVLAVEAARYCDRYGAWAAVVAFVLVLGVSLLVAFYTVTACVVWVWYHSRNPRLKFEAACYLLGAMKDTGAVQEQIDHEFPPVSPE